jgi:4-hydroxy-tetrahydrodipicolinate synthase
MALAIEGAMRSINPVDLDGRLIPAVPVPLDSSGALHNSALDAYVSWMVQQPIGGVAVWAHTGRGLKLPPALADRILKTWRAGLPSTSLLVAAAGAATPPKSAQALFEQAYSMACRAAELGADALLVHPPAALRDRSDRDSLVIRYHSRIAQAGLPLVIFYLYEAAGGISYTPGVIAELLARPDVLGIKIATLDSVMTFQEITRLVQTHTPEKVVITGEDRFLPYSLMCGAKAALIGMAAACTAVQAELLRSHLQGHSRDFLALSSRVDDLAQHTFLSPMEGYIQRMLWCLVHQQVIPREAAHDPWGPELDPAEFDRIGACVARVLQASGATERDSLPPGNTAS